MLVCISSFLTSEIPPPVTSSQLHQKCWCTKPFLPDSKYATPFRSIISKNTALGFQISTPKLAFLLYSVTTWQITSRPTEISSTMDDHVLEPFYWDNKSSRYSNPPNAAVVMSPLRPCIHFFLLLLDDGYTISTKNVYAPHPNIMVYGGHGPLPTR